MMLTARQDQAHLPNERISLTNLRRGKSVVERFFTNVASRVHIDDHTA